MELISEKETIFLGANQSQAANNFAYKTLFYLGNIIELEFSFDITKVHIELEALAKEWKPFEPQNRESNINCLSFIGPMAEAPIASFKPLIDYFYLQIAKIQVLRLDAGSLFQPKTTNQTDRFYIVVPLAGVCRNNFVFIYDEKRLILEVGNAYIVNRNVKHSFYSFAPCSLLFCEVLLTQEALAKVKLALSQK